VGCRHFAHIQCVLSVGKVLDVDVENVLSSSAVAAFESKYLDVSTQPPWRFTKGEISKGNASTNYRRTLTDIGRTTTAVVTTRTGAGVGCDILVTDLVNGHG